MNTKNGDDLYEDKFARVYAEIVRIDQLRAADAEAAKELADEREKRAVERDQRLDQRMDNADKATVTALTSAKEAVTAALVASEKAVDKAEVAQGKVNETQNEFRGSLKDQAQTLMPRQETENLIRELRGLINGNASELAGLRSRVDVGPPSLSALQAVSDEQRGQRAQQGETRQTQQFSTGTAVAIVSVVLLFVGIAVSVVLAVTLR